MTIGLGLERIVTVGKQIVERLEHIVKPRKSTVRAMIDCRG